MIGTTMHIWATMTAARLCFQLSPEDTIELLNSQVAALKLSEIQSKQNAKVDQVRRAGITGSMSAFENFGLSEDGADCTSHEKSLYERFILENIL